MRKLASWCFRHRALTIAAWIVALVGLDAIHSRGGQRLHRQLQAAAHAELRRDPACCSEARPRASGETDQLVIAVTQRQGHRPRCARARRGAVRQGGPGCRTWRAVGSPYTPAGEQQISPSRPGRVRQRDLRRNAAQPNKITASAGQAVRHRRSRRHRWAATAVSSSRSRATSPQAGKQRQLADRPDLRLHRRGGRAVPRVRLRAGDAAAAGHRRRVARRRDRRHRFALARDRGWRRSRASWRC